MALAAAEALDLDLAASWVVGDSACDVGLARAVGARALSDRQPRTARAETDVRRVPDLAAAVDTVLAELAGPASRHPGRRVPVQALRGRRERTRAEYTHELERAMSSIDLRRGRERPRRSSTGAYREDRAVFACGNGGSASIANHLQCDHVKGVRVGTDLHARGS